MGSFELDYVLLANGGVLDPCYEIWQYFANSFRTAPALIGNLGHQAYVVCPPPGPFLVSLYDHLGIVSGKIQVKCQWPLYVPPG